MTTTRDSRSSSYDSTSPAHRSKDEITPFPCFVGLLYPRRTPSRIAIATGVRFPSLLRRGSAKPSDISLMPSVRRATGDGRASHTTTGRRLPALHLRRGRRAGRAASPLAESRILTRPVWINVVGRWAVHLFMCEQENAGPRLAVP